ncbi:hypothetical protein A3C98_05210 [Candidatus Roizmanbacteria bacterium RIFCSPHIGHO2_02_FULL_37_15]|uniref:DUF2207 domain-containing protein n=1 Tax=Candidatus Roizmanbacteria bacterium RIFCSPLOWO2_01_FULL_37_16 TaxID=1802058 RepID=A0A1F7ILC9_9BACT|nr:MAG: hypothetical protein A3C98_05210 [Candidatus Roizmanbacteria bacterium RIFCSPHIGHO2_02_FULL_37_15]OGK44149.1 MAG: hypothetical protein A3B40_04715 [Candidatus Roizmanbacteria bacterium RIFCSPLOWO2_01_FULL_37_16]
MIKRFLTILVFLAIFLQLGSAVDAKEQIQNFDSKININKDGTIEVEEKIVYDFGNLQRHGIYRNTPYIKTNKAGKKFELEFENFSVTDENGKKYQYKKSVSNENINLKIGDPNRTITGVNIYLIKYKVSGALTYFSDHDELYWNSNGNEWTIPILSLTSEVRLPVGVAQREISASCYTGYLGSKDQDCQINKTDISATFKTIGILEPNQGLTLVFGFPKNIALLLEPKPYVSFWQSFVGKAILGMIILVAIFWYIVYPIYIPVKWLREGRDPSTRSARSGQVPGEVSAWFDPPKTKTGRPLTPQETGALVDERVDIDDLSAMIVSLAQKGFMKIEEREKNNFYLVKKKDSSDSRLLTFEKKFLDEIFQGGETISLKNKKPSLNTVVEESKKSIYEKLVQEGFFPENPNKIRTFYTVIGSLALTTINFALAFSAFLFGRNMPKKTLLGVEASSIAKSLRKFLVSQERQLEFQAKNQMFFEKLLPYAIAFGVEKIWADRFKDIEMRPPDWYEGYSTGRFNSIALTNSLNSSFSSFQSAATPTTSSSGFSSGFSGGSSGGGGGGGGGGSW